MKLLVLISCLIAAIICYLAGASGIAGIFILAGLFFEGAFWLKLDKYFRRKKQKP